ncbi:hypothetical protein TREMEDRAFT_62560 [Tremella mesenterica DSM 1558]|uniref:uncharacterized protein n=1 Tax=Tremella mesenterica (strain ATCC 24925 / CBS 8224 / DSM 1558 / NBRC 9311 / NRRL Y-6157 / RJB 2259-6 / UBC 559-6) TaxID=578456 RepID=UPI0003F4902E|nr:uncharacterized protein TREMEDRAFT_62560 [Tremella mesenterica DSM 1558]EIW69691.1 hypothetical protein TREMEDRAFT_62560 [Tremella mesenterica DSM 1558]
MSHHDAVEIHAGDIDEIEEDDVEVILCPLSISSHCLFPSSSSSAYSRFHSTRTDTSSYSSSVSTSTFHSTSTQNAPTSEETANLDNSPVDDISENGKDDRPDVPNLPDQTFFISHDPIGHFLDVENHGYCPEEFRTVEGDEIDIDSDLLDLISLPFSPSFSESGESSCFNTSTVKETLGSRLECTSSSLRNSSSVDDVSTFGNSITTRMVPIIPPATIIREVEGNEEEDDDGHGNGHGGSAEGLSKGIERTEAIEHGARNEREEMDELDEVDYCQKGNIGIERSMDDGLTNTILDVLTEKSIVLEDQLRKTEKLRKNEIGPSPSHSFGDLDCLDSTNESKEWDDLDCLEDDDVGINTNTDSSPHPTILYDGDQVDVSNHLRASVWDTQEGFEEDWECQSLNSGVESLPPSRSNSPSPLVDRVQGRTYESSCTSVSMNCREEETTQYGLQTPYSNSPSSIRSVDEISPIVQVSHSVNHKSPFESIVPSEYEHDHSTSPCPKRTKSTLAFSSLDSPSSDRFRVDSISEQESSRNRQTGIEGFKTVSKGNTREERPGNISNPIIVEEEQQSLREASVIPRQILPPSTGPQRSKTRWPPWGDNTIQSRMQEITCDTCQGRLHYACASLHDDDDMRGEPYSCPPCVTLYSMSSPSLSPSPTTPSNLPNLPNSSSSPSSSSNNLPSNSLISKSTSTTNTKSKNLVPRKIRGRIVPIAPHDRCIRPDCILRSRISLKRKRDDTELYYFERIIGRRVLHRLGNGKRVFEFLVKWEGWEIYDSTWEKSRNIPHVEVQHELFEIMAKRQGLEMMTRTCLLNEAEEWWDDMGELKRDKLEMLGVQPAPWWD